MKKRGFNCAFFFYRKIADKEFPFPALSSSYLSLPPVFHETAVVSQAVRTVCWVQGLQLLELSTYPEQSFASVTAQPTQISHRCKIISRGLQQLKSDKPVFALRLSTCFAIVSKKSPTCTPSLRF